MRKQIASNVFSGYVNRVLSVIVGLLLIPFLMSKLGKEAYGLIIVSESLILFSDIITRSLRLALSRHAAFALSRNQPEEFIQYLSTGRILLLWISLVLFVVGTITSYFFPRLFNVPVLLISQSRYLFFLISVSFVVSIPNIVYWSVLFAKNRFDYINAVLSFGVLFRAFGVFFVFSFCPQRFHTIVYYGLVYLAMTLGQNYFVFSLHKKVLSYLQIGFGHFDKKKVRQLLLFGANFSMSRIGTLFYENAAYIVINIFFGSLYTTFYSIGSKFPIVIQTFFQDSAWNLTPSFTMFAAQDDKKKVLNLCIIYIKLISSFLAFLSAALYFFGENMIKVWVGPGFDVSVMIMHIYLLPLFIVLPLAICDSIISAYAKVRLPGRLSLTLALLNLTAVIFISNNTKLGLTGVACSCVFFSSLNSIILLFYTEHIIGEILISRVVKVWLLVAFLIVVIIVQFLLISKFFCATVLTKLILFFFLGIEYCIVTYRFLFDQREKQQLGSTAGMFFKHG